MTRRKDSSAITVKIGSDNVAIPSQATLDEIFFHLVNSRMILYNVDCELSVTIDGIKVPVLKDDTVNLLKERYFDLINSKRRENK